MIKLADVTLVMVETLCHDLAKVAVEDCTKHCEFGEVLVFSDKNLNIPGASYVEVENWPSKLGWSEWLWYGVPEYIKTSQALLIQWDAGICKPEMWSEKFLSYDYIGAPWHWHEAHNNVGNSGFSLRSKRLQDFLVANRDKYPVKDPEDVAISISYRDALQNQGFKWADGKTAWDFAFECTKKPSLEHFGYHAMRNWVFVLDPDELQRRVSLASKIPYIETSGMMGQIRDLAPHLAFN